MQQEPRHLNNFVKVLTTSLSLIATLFALAACEGAAFKAEEQKNTNNASLNTPAQADMNFSCASSNGTVQGGFTYYGYARSSVIYPGTCGGKVTSTCQSSGKFDGPVPVYESCSRLCLHPDTQQPVNPGTQYFSFNKAQADTQALCDTGKVTSICNADTGAFLPAIPKTRSSSCLVQGQVCAYTVGPNINNPTGNRMGATATGFASASATFPSLCGAQGTVTCKTDGAWTGSTPRYTNCTQKCLHPDSNQPVDANSTFVFFKIASGTQEECDAARSTSACAANTGTFTPAIPGTRYQSCAVKLKPADPTNLTVEVVTTAPLRIRLRVVDNSANETAFHWFNSATASTPDLDAVKIGSTAANTASFELNAEYAKEYYFSAQAENAGLFSNQTARVMFKYEEPVATPTPEPTATPIPTPTPPATITSLVSVTPEIPFMQMLGTVQLLGNNANLMSVPEMGISSEETIGGSSLRFGKVFDPLDNTRKVFRHAILKTDVQTNGFRVDVTPMNETLLKDTVYWVAMQVFVPAETRNAQDTSSLASIQSGSTLGLANWDLQLINGNLKVIKHWNTSAGVDAANQESKQFDLGTPLPADQWVRIVVKWKASFTEVGGGFLQVWINGKLEVDDVGPNTINATGDYARYGYHNFAWDQDGGDDTQLAREILWHSYHLLRDQNYTLEQVLGFLK